MVTITIIAVGVFGVCVGFVIGLLAGKDAGYEEVFPAPTGDVKPGYVRIYPSDWLGSNERIKRISEDMRRAME